MKYATPHDIASSCSRNQFLTTITLLSLCMGTAMAEPVQWSIDDGGNGHWYEVVEDELNWFEADDLAAARGGYLVTITSSDENQVLCNAGLPDDGGRPYWTSGIRQGGSWSWLNGDSWGYTNWDGIEPNGCCSYGGHGAIYLVWRPWHNVAICGWDDTNPFHCSNDPGCTPRTLIEYSADCNGDGIVDYGQILDGSLEDADGNGVPDCCDQGEPCDDYDETGPVQWTLEEGGNGHWYEFVDLIELTDWDVARNMCLSAGGSLCTLGSAGENSFASTLPVGSNTMLGGYRSGSQWHWVTGEPWNYTNWNQNDCHPSWQPDNSSGVEDKLFFQCEMETGDRKWNDYVGDTSWGGGGGRSYVIEWSADCNGDGIVDYGQILDGSLEDADGNGVPDCCDQGEPCDAPVTNHVLELVGWPDAAVIPHDQSITPLDAMTIEFWIKSNGSNGDGRPITKRPGNGGCYTISSNQGADGCVAGADVFGSCNSAHWGEIPCEWVHLALTVDGATGIARAYRNGELVSEHDQGGSCTIGQGSWDLRFGNTPGFSTTQFIGCLDNIRVWNTPLDEQQVQYWMNTDITPEIAGKLPELGGSWNFEDGVTDATGVNDGWLEGGAMIVEDGPIVTPDCDGDGVSDAQELAEGSTDYDSDGVPDECQCLSDLDADQQVAVNDLLVVIAQWGSGSTLGDINRDGTVDVNDLLLVIQGWGDCP